MKNLNIASSILNRSWHIHSISIKSTDIIQPSNWVDIFGALLKCKESFDSILFKKCSLHFISGSLNETFEKIHEMLANASVGLIIGGFNDSKRWLKHFSITLGEKQLLIFNPNETSSTKISNGVDVVIGIGSNRELNEAKRLACDYFPASTLILVPSSLATDSFLTNKYRRTGDSFLTESRSGRFPDIVIIPMGLIKSAPSRTNGSGIGEGLSIYSSIRELGYLRKVTDLDEAIEATEEILLITEKSLLVSTTRHYFILVILIFKCLIMWSTKDVTYGAASEHAIAYALERNGFSFFIHGEGCAFGSWLVCNYLSQYHSNWINLPRLSRVLKNAKLPFSPSQLGLSKETVIDILREARMVRKERDMLINNLSDTDLHIMAEMVY